MKPEMREELLRKLAELEQQSKGEIRRIEKPPVNTVKKGTPVVTKDEWERIKNVARDPSIKLRRVAQPPTDRP